MNTELLKHRIVVNPEVAAREVEGEVWIVSSANKQLHNLNEVGSRIWALADGRHSLEDIAELLEGEFDAPREEILRDLQEFVSQLKQKGLLISRSPECEDETQG